ncbi:MAG: hypothetical protein AB1898_29710 [Acidobacteriota bacterium]
MEKRTSKVAKPSAFLGWLALSVVPCCLLSSGSPLSESGSWTSRSFAGRGTPGYSGDGKPAVQAQLNNPFGVTRGPDGAIYFCDTGNHVIRRIAADGIVSTVAGDGTPGYSGDGGPALKAQLNEPYEVRFDESGSLYFVERLNHVVRKVDGRSGKISTIAGTGAPGFSGDGGPAHRARLRQPHSLQFDSEGNLYICDIGNHRIRRIEKKGGSIRTFAGTGQAGATPEGSPLQGTPLNGPRALDFDREGNLWLALREGNAVYRLDRRASRWHHIAGTGQEGFTGNGGPARQARLSGPKGLAVGPDGNIYLADTESHSIRMIDVQTGRLEWIAGTGRRGNGPDGDPMACGMSRPHGIFVDTDGSIFVGDSEAHRVRLIRRSGPPR